MLSMTENKDDITKTFSSQHYARLCDNSMEAARKYLALFQNSEMAEELQDEKSMKHELVERLKKKGMNVANIKWSLDTLTRKVAELKA